MEMVTYLTVWLLHSDRPSPLLGRHTNQRHSILPPTQRLVYLGLSIDTRYETAQPTGDATGTRDCGTNGFSA
jgi:hypothetical protein